MKQISMRDEMTQQLTTTVDLFIFLGIKFLGLGKTYTFVDI